MEPNTLTRDTICAISTPPGVGGVAVARVSGPEAADILARIWRGRPVAEITPRRATLGTVIGTDGRPLDQALVTIYRAPASYTGEDVVEIATHGSLWVQHELIASLIAAGARLADPGEFTRRAFAAGRIDLAEAEGIADMIASRSRAAHRLAMSQMRGDLSRRLASLRNDFLNLASLLELELDFSEEEVEFASRERLLDIARQTLAEVERLAGTFAAGSAIRDGIPVAIVGETNVGKSSILNALTMHDRAIVSDIHGTTRDLVEETITIADHTFRLVDTAGLRTTTDTIERLGIERSLDAISRAAIVVHVVAPDSRDSENAEIDRRAAEAGARLITVLNKVDLLPSSEWPDQPSLRISALSADGVEPLREALIAIANEMAPESGDIVLTNRRHYDALTAAIAPLRAVITGLRSGISADFIAQDLRQALHHLGTVTGAVTPADILASIFSRFCIGK